MTGPLSEALIQAAIGWAVRLNYSQPTPQDHLAFEQWLRADPLHGIAWQRVSGLRSFETGSGPLPSGLARATLATAQGMRTGQRHAQRRKALKLLAWAGVATTTGWLGREFTPWQRMLADASTRVGEQKTLNLDDGSVIVLNTDSAISIDLSGPSRLITLRRGELLITTGADVQAATRQGGRRAFWVDTPYGRLQALGTRFTVRLGQGHARVTVQEGAVQLYPAGGAESVVAQAGESRNLGLGGVQPGEAQAFGADDWAEGVIAGKDMRLEDLLAEMARYRQGRLVCDPRVADLRVSGLFHVKDTDQALQFLAQTQPIKVSQRTRWWVSVGPVERR